MAASKDYINAYRKMRPDIEESYTKGGHRAYNNIKQRCNNPNHPSYHNYGGRGIRCNLTIDEFLDIYFSTDACEMCGDKVDDEKRLSKKGRTLDRVDQAKSYEMGNLRILCRSCNCSLGFKRKKSK